MALIKTPKEIKLLARGGKILAEILRKLALAVRPEISTWDLDILARNTIKASGAKAAFPGYQIHKDFPPYPATLCVAVNEEIVHGIPKKESRLNEGDILSLDLGIRYKGLYTDAAVTVGVGKISREANKLIEVTNLALQTAIQEMRLGKTLGDLGFAISEVAKRHKLGVVKELGGHGVGHAIHEQPFVLNFGKRGSLQKLEVGMVLAIEPMFTSSSSGRIKILDDGWTVVSADGSLSAHFEHTVAVTEKGPLVLTELASGV